MPHNWKAFEAAKKITDRLIEGKLIAPEMELKVRGIIQIVLEEK